MLFWQFMQAGLHILLKIQKWFLKGKYPTW